MTEETTDPAPSPTLPESILAEIRTHLPSVDVSLLRNPSPSAQHSLLVAPADLPAVARFLRDAAGFDFLSNITGIDWPDPAAADAVAVPENPAPSEATPSPRSGFLETVYHFYSTTGRAGPLVLRARTTDRADNNHLPSLSFIYRSAEFQEREIFDLFGITFTGHPDLRRILMWDEFKDHPMRKDYLPPDDYEYEPTPHDEVLEKAKAHHPSKETKDGKTQEKRPLADAHFDF